MAARCVRLILRERAAEFGSAFVGRGTGEGSKREGGEEEEEGRQRGLSLGFSILTGKGMVLEGRTFWWREKRLNRWELGSGSVVEGVLEEKVGSEDIREEEE